MLGALLEACKGETALCVASDLTLASEEVATRCIADWRKRRHVIGKRPTVFLLLSG
jgi:16S rRNA (cytidine1402-2'-O)-methyltransferase